MGLSALFIATLLAQASPQPSASAAPTTFTFAAPSGWKSVGIHGSAPAGNEQLTIVGMWTSGAPAFETLIVQVASGAAKSLDDYGAVAQKSLGTLKGLTAQPPTPVVLCGGIPGRLIKYTFDSPQARLSGSEIFAVNEGRVYAVAYIHKADSPDTPAALDAMSGLCPVGAPSAIEAKQDSPPPLTAPAGWTQASLGMNVNTAAGGASLWLWTNAAAPPGKTEIIEAVSLRFSLPVSAPTTADDDRIVDSFIHAMSAWASDVKVVDRKPIQLCDVSGIAVHFTGTAFTKPMDMQVVLAPATPTMLAAVYMHPLGTPENPDAMKAIDSLCPRTAPLAT
jgi:hypothetical protein